ncbi:MAG: cysteine desulfurase family protein [Bauldia sp.]
MTAKRVYLDYNAGAPLRATARAAMIDALSETGNASSVHAEGRGSRRRIEAARSAVAALVGADPKRVSFVSGGSEANATVLSPTATIGGRAVWFDRLLVGATEHPSVLAGGRFPADRVETIAVDGEGRIDLAELAAKLRRAAAVQETVLVSVMAANNETGTLQPVARIAALAHEHGAAFHCDAAQAVGRVAVDINAIGADFLTFSSHKIGGPQGAGAIVAREEGTAPAPLILGGRQERGARAGTENVAAIVGFGAAAAEAAEDLATAPVRWRAFRGRVEAFVAADPRVAILSEGADRLPQTVCLALRGVSAETLVIGLDLEGIAISSGAACSSGKVGPSHVLAAMGVAPELARSAIRLSFGWETDENDLDMFQSAWKRVTARIFAAGDHRAA